ncbi:hypothetical protein [Sinomicrobium oceani]|uniref:hypothetical protein n=1 Tax=Sinomicrobium oceani TaxID=1150368 RepID=UPI00227D21BB|nr:hypothetical protein [Sinomicrobium oceani]
MASYFDKPGYFPVYMLDQFYTLFKFKAPIISTFFGKVFPFDPLSVSVVVSVLRPAPDDPEACVIYFFKGVPGYYVLIVVAPAPNDRI